MSLAVFNESFESRRCLGTEITGCMPYEISKRRLSWAPQSESFREFPCKYDFRIDTSERYRRKQLDGTHRFHSNAQESSLLDITEAICQGGSVCSGKHSRTKSADFLQVRDTDEIASYQFGSVEPHKNNSNRESTLLQCLAVKIHNLRIKMTRDMKFQVNAIVHTMLMILNYRTSAECRVKLAEMLSLLKSADFLNAVVKQIFNSPVQLDPEIERWLIDDVCFGIVEPEIVNLKNRKSNNLVLLVDSVATESDSVLTALQREALTQWSFDTMSVADNEALVIFKSMLEALGCFEIYTVNPHTLRNFFHAVQNGYNENPYHNFSHGLDVVQAAYVLLVSYGAADLLTPLESMSLLFAALLHDLQHPGLNNAYQINSRSTIAQCYHDQSVLENYHLKASFELLSRSGCNVFEALNPADKMEVRQHIIKSILATDIDVHMDILTKYNSKVTYFDKTNRNHRAMLVQMVLKCADVSNPVRPIQLAKAWADRIQEECWKQGDLESLQGLPVSPFCDRYETSQSEMSLRFLDYIVTPLFTTMQHTLPKVKECITGIKSTRDFWQDQHENM